MKALIIAGVIAVATPGLALAATTTADTTVTDTMMDDDNGDDDDFPWGLLGLLGLAGLLGRRNDRDVHHTTTVDRDRVNRP